MVLGRWGPGVPCSPRGSHCCCLLFKEIPQEIPQQPTNWSRQALEARELAERYTCKSRTPALSARTDTGLGPSSCSRALCSWLAVMDGDVGALSLGFMVPIAEGPREPDAV